MDHTQEAPVDHTQEIPVLTADMSGGLFRLVTPSHILKTNAFHHWVKANGLPPEIGSYSEIGSLLARKIFEQKAGETTSMGTINTVQFTEDGKITLKLSATTAAMDYVLANSHSIRKQEMDALRQSVAGQDHISFEITLLARDYSSRPRPTVQDFCAAAEAAGFTVSQTPQLLEEDMGSPDRILTLNQTGKMDALDYIVQNWRAAARSDCGPTVNDFLDYEWVAAEGGYPYNNDLYYQGEPSKEGMQSLRRMMLDCPQDIFDVRYGVSYSLTI